MHWVQTSWLLWAPLAVTTLTRCRFGLNVRRVMPVILVPTPPRYFFLPRMVTWLPIWGPLPQTSHFLAMIDPVLSKNAMSWSPHQGAGPSDDRCRCFSDAADLVVDRSN